MSRSLDLNNNNHDQHREIISVKNHRKKSPQPDSVVDKFNETMEKQNQAFLNFNFASSSSPAQPKLKFFPRAPVIPIPSFPSPHDRVPSPIIEAKHDKICTIPPVTISKDEPYWDNHPIDFFYVENSIMVSGVPSINFDAVIGCQCEDANCGKFGVQCACLDDNEYMPYYSNEGQLLLVPGRLIRECNSKCKCGPMCTNRVAQKGRNMTLDIFQTISKGWGVRARNNIPANTFIDFYTGIIMPKSEADALVPKYTQSGRSYLFDLDFHQPVFYTVDSNYFGNVTRFFNHSCDPNLSVYSILIESMDIKMPNIGFFTRRPVKEGEELTFDYFGLRHRKRSKAFDESSIVLEPGQRFCRCGAKECRRIINI
ncbi:12186_t:CDS:2 [Ambispora gerdemannii]|uniref:12186_t:CDS:1 n=1 Tax=Ambispora gerdemannii TaxID=144530 RepID=A0A9N9E4P2_9GLOM|nr:12186_t:CDS:2 [Ambispora gerdemannii]